MNLSYVALGSNLGDSPGTLRRAAAELAQLATGPLRLSTIYRSAPVGPPGQADYLNAVAEVPTTLSPYPLLDALQAIEEQAGRVRREHWGPRTLDLDILLYDSLQLAEERLQIPHRQIKERDFVLQPLADLLGGDYRLPTGESIAALLARCDDNQLRDSGLSWQLPARTREQTGT